MTSRLRFRLDFMSALLTFQAPNCYVVAGFCAILCPNRTYAAQYSEFGRGPAEEARMAGHYDDRDGKIWMDGKLVDWRDANVHC